MSKALAELVRQKAEEAHIPLAKFRMRIGLSSQLYGIWNRGKSKALPETTLRILNAIKEVVPQTELAPLGESPVGTESNEDGLYNLRGHLEELISLKRKSIRTLEDQIAAIHVVIQSLS